MATKLKAGVITAINVFDIQKDPQQPRKNFDSAELNKLGDSMKVKQQYPIMVRYDGKKLIIVDGERRWRAAKLRSIDKIDCMLWDGSDEMSIRWAQLVTSEHRQPLNPMEAASFVLHMQKREKKSPNELLAILSKMGLTEISATKLDKLIQYNEFPEWLQTMIANGEIPASAADSLVPCLQYPKLFPHLKRSLSDIKDWRGSVSSKELTEEIHQSFGELGHDLNFKHGPESRIRHFAIDICLKCEHYKKIAKTEFCMEPAKFTEKNEQALALKASKAAERASKQEEKAKEPGSRSNPDPTQVSVREVKVSSKGIVVMSKLKDADYRDLETASFDTAICNSCPHKHIGSHDGKDKSTEVICLHPPCYEAKTEADKRFLSRKEHLRDHLEIWLRPKLIDLVSSQISDKDKLALTFWLAAGAVDEFSKWHSGQMHARAAEMTEKNFLSRNALPNLPAFLKLAQDPIAHSYWNDLTRSAIMTMTRDQLRMFAQYQNLNLQTQPLLYRIDMEFLNLQRKSQLLELAKISGMTTVKGLGVKQLKDELLKPERREVIGVPSSIEEIYREPFTTKDQFAEDLDNVFDDEDERVCISCGCTDLDACPDGCAWIVTSDNLGLCSTPACASLLALWKSGVRDLTNEAKARAAERKRALDEIIAPAKESIAEPAKDKKKRSRK